MILLQIPPTYNYIKFIKVFNSVSMRHAKLWGRKRLLRVKVKFLFNK